MIDLCKVYCGPPLSVCVHVESGGRLQAMKAMKAMKAARLPARDVADPLLPVVSFGMPWSILPLLKGSSHRNEETILSPIALAIRKSSAPLNRPAPGRP